MFLCVHDVLLVSSVRVLLCCLGLCPFSGLVCDPLVGQWSRIFSRMRIARSISVTILTSTVSNGPRYSRQSCLPWVMLVYQDKHCSRNRMSSSTSKQTNSFKVKTRHKNDVVRRLYWALIKHERDTDMTAPTGSRLACHHVHV